MAKFDAAEQVKRIAQQHGFELCGITSAGPVPHHEFVSEWLRLGHAGEMTYLCRHQDSRRDVREWLPWAQSVIVVGLYYFREEPRGGPCGSSDSATLRTRGSRGRVAMYARGRDYHRIMRLRLERMVRGLRREFGAALQARVCVDTSAILERSLASAAGLGWIGKNTMVIHPRMGSFFFLGEIVTDLALAPDQPMPDRCGTCRRCLEACPTGAFPAPYLMDARRCISYLTIEHRGEIEPRLADRMGNWVFGCDICQTVCPYNRRPAESREPGFQFELDAAHPLLERILGWDEAEYREATRGKATRRAKLPMWRRNAQIALRNIADRAPDQSGLGQT